MGEKVRNNGPRVVRILLLGYVGCNNLGDDLMMLDTIDFLRKNIPECEITLGVRYQGPVRMPEWGENVKILNLHRFRVGKIKETLYRYIFVKRFDLTVVVGGTVFGDIGLNGIYPYLSSNIVTKKAYGYLGIGIDYLENPKKLEQATKLLKNAAFVSLRDKSSFDEAERIAKRSDFHLTEDIVYDVLKKRSCEEKPKKPRLLVSFRYLTQYISCQNEAKLKESVLKLILDNIEKYREIAFVPIDEKLDFEANFCMYEELKKALTNNDIIDTEIIFKAHMSPEEKISYIEESDTYITGRLHGMMIGELSGVNTVALSYSKKTKVFLDSIKRTCDMADIFIADEFENSLRSAYNAGVSEHEVMSEILSKKSADAVKNFEILKSVCYPE